MISSAGPCLVLVGVRRLGNASSRRFDNYRMVRQYDGYDSTGARQVCVRNVAIHKSGEESVRNGAAC
jgi:hypothetical protein